MATGDLKGCLRKLQASLRSVKYPRDVDYQRLAKGDPFCCLPILSYAFTSFSPAVAELLVESGIELTGKNDLSFTCTIYKVLRDLFSYKPLLSKQQFLQFGFAERKISLLCDIIGLVLNKHQQLTKGSQPVGQTKRGLLSRSDSKTSGSPASPDRPRFPAQRLLSRSDSKTSGSPASPDRPRFPAQRQLSRSDSKTSGSPASPDRPRFPAQRQLSRSDSKTSGIPASPDRPRFPAQRQLSRSDSNTLRSPTSPDPHCTSAHRLLSCSDSKASESPTSPDSQRIPVVPRVERHLSSSSLARGSFSSDEVLQEKPDEEEAGDLSAGDSPPPAAHTGCVSQCALSAVEKGLRECVSRLVQLDARLQALERSTAGKVVMERSQWENLESRVVLLETSLALTSTQAPVKAAGVMSLPASGDESHLPEDTGPGSIAAVRPYAAEARSATPTPVGLHTASTEETIKERLERLANMMKDTSSLLKTTF